MTIFWFRRDLRLYDNAGFFKALASGNDVLPIFIFDKNILDGLPRDDARVTFIADALHAFHSELKNHGRSLAVFHDEPKTVFEQLVREHEITAVYANDDYEPYALQRDTAIADLLARHKIPFHKVKDQVIFEKAEIVKPDGTPYVVYTPYSNQWKSKLSPELLEAFPSQEHLTKVAKHDYPMLRLEEVGFRRSGIEIPKVNLSEPFIDAYQSTRNFPSIETSRLGIHLRFGTVSIRDIVNRAVQSKKETFLNELIWREFFMQILWHFPRTVTKSFRPAYDRIPWRNDVAQFHVWCEGKTGYPLVDAGMRELNATGFMHNRVRMVTASFLCKHLLIDWRWGEAYFAEKLLDYEQASNIGNWQWNAGSGVDAAPYFRIFNPETQIEKFDSEYLYIKKWVPEIGTDNYPKPIVDHKEARERCLAVFKDALA